MEKLQPLAYLNMSESRLYLLLFFQEKYDYFLHYLAGNRAGSQVKGSESKFHWFCFNRTISGQLFVNVLIPGLSNFAAKGHKGHFRKILTWISSLAAFLVTTPHLHIWKKVRFPNAQLSIDWHQFQILKIKNWIAPMSFSNSNYSFWHHFN